MTNRDTIKKYQERAKREIERLEQQGYNVPDSIKLRANRPIVRATSKDVEVYKDLLSWAHIRQITRMNTKIRSVKRSIDLPYATPIYTDEGNYDYERMKMRSKKTTIEVNKMNAAKTIQELGNTVDKYPSLDSGETVYKLLTSMQEMSNIKIIPDEVGAEASKEINSYMPSTDKLNEIINEAIEREPIEEVVYNVIVNAKEEILKKSGITEKQRAGRVLQGWELAKGTFGEHYKFSQSHIDAIFAMYSELGKRWDIYRKGLPDSNDFMRDLDSYLTFCSNNTIDPNFELFDTLVTKGTPPLQLFDIMKEDAEKQKQYLEGMR